MLLIVPPASVAAPRPAPPPLQDAVTGTSTLHNDPNVDVGPSGFTRIDARSGPQGENPTGTFSAHFGGGNGPTYSGTVTCLSVAGTRAVMGVAGTVVSFGSGEPFSAIVLVLDGGPAASQPPWPDRFSFNPLPLPGPTNCSAPAPTLPFQFAASDITVVDAPSLPTNKEQCKNRRWHDFGDSVLDSTEGSAR